MMLDHHRLGGDPGGGGTKGEGNTGGERDNV